MRPGVLVTGGVILGEAAYRRLTTQRGTLEYDPNYGFSLAGWLNKRMTPDELAEAPSLIRAELLKDERLERVDITITQPTPSSASVAIQGWGSGATSFALVLEVADVDAGGVSILHIDGA